MSSDPFTCRLPADANELAAVLSNPERCPVCGTAVAEIDRALGGVIVCRGCKEWQLDTGVCWATATMAGVKPVALAMYSPLWSRRTPPRPDPLELAPGQGEPNSSAKFVGEQALK